jgi:predicted NBD/HSP70 family sugar kinase
MKIFGIDVGGSRIKGAPVDTETGELLVERVRIKTPQPATPEGDGSDGGRCREAVRVGRPRRVLLPRRRQGETSTHPDALVKPLEKVARCTPAHRATSPRGR